MSTLRWLQLAMGTTFVLAGLIAWRARPGNRTGAIMLLYGAMVLVGRLLVELDAPAAITIGILVGDAPAAVLLAFPYGRMWSRTDWLILGPAVLVFGPLELLRLAFFELPGNLLLVSADAGLADAIDWVQRTLLGIADVTLAVVLVRRWLRASPPMRRVLAPVLVGAAAITVGTFALLRDKVAGARTDLIGWITAITFCALPVALLANLLRVRLARTPVGGLVLDLRRDSDPAHLRDALRRALRDPSLELAFWLPRRR